MRTHLTLVFLSVATLLVIPSYIVADPGPTTSQAALVNAAKEQEKLRADIEAKQMALLEQQLNSAIKELDLLRKTNVDKQPLDAFAALLDVKRAELDLRRAAAKAKTAIDGAVIVADDGQVLGALRPSYDAASIFCTFGPYGANYSATSIWCSYGKYGASYQLASPFCSYSTTPPKIVINGKIVAFLSVNDANLPLAISPGLLRTVYGVQEKEP